MFQFDEDHHEIPQKQEDKYMQEEDIESDEEDLHEREITLETIKKMLEQYDQMHAEDGKTILNLLNQVPLSQHCVF